MGDPSPAPRWWPQFVWATAAAVVVDLGTLHRQHNADAIVPALVSVYRWTFYYWEQNRYGMLVALLASPFDHPFTNLLVQNGITIWAGLVCFPLAARYLFRDRTWPLTGPAAAAIFLFAAPAQIQWMFLSTYNVYSTGLALALTGLLAVARIDWPAAGRWAAGLGCFALASWANSAIGVLTFAVVVSTGAARWAGGLTPTAGRPLARDVLPGAALSAFGVGFALVCQWLAPYHTTPLEVPPVGDWPGLVQLMLGRFLGEITPAGWAAALGAALLGGAAFAARPGADRRRWAVAGAVAAAAGLYWAAMGVLFDGRWWYGLPGLVLAHTAAVGVGVGPAAGRAGRGGAAAAGAAVVAAAVWAYGWPSAAGVRADLDAKFGAGTRELTAAGCTHVVGDYWRVWPAVFLVNCEAADRGDPRVVWGVAHRSLPTSDLWLAVPRAEVRVGAFAGDEWADVYLPRIGVQVREAQRRGPIVVYVPE